MLGISNEKPWQRQHWHALQTAYGKAPFFEDYAPYFAPYYLQSYEKLWDFNLDLLKQCLKLLALPDSGHFTTSFEKNPIEPLVDFRSEKGIHIENQPAYYQGFADKTGFIDNLSIVDLLFQLGPQSKAYLQTCSKQVTNA